ncbi:MAG: SMP-30/gluconolactonase/LRE family protein [Streptosporangiales bacterium]|nr:SMP-30/gluconolactonase/LRE family protein [Streptosporangiales bacterium]MBO0891480.1 SMP-30/gluconolactonase/LRE family protein [Acidothermales bacterium]
MWDVATQRLFSVDMLAGDLLALDTESGRTTRTHVHDVVACVRPRRGGGYVLGVERGFALLPGGGDTPELLPELWTDRGVRMNEGGCDPQGRFYCGSMGYDKAPGRGTVWRLDPDGTTGVVLTGVTISNGLVWSLDGTAAYYIDTPTRRVDVFDFDGATGTFHGRRPVVEVPEGQGKPDGMTIDDEGGLWVALYGGGCVRRYRADGGLDLQVDLPVSNVTACAFGGAGLDELYITTSREGLDRDAEPEAGAVYRAVPGARGLPAATFAG